MMIDSDYQIERGEVDAVVDDSYACYQVLIFLIIISPNIQLKFPLPTWNLMKLFDRTSWIY